MALLVNPKEQLLVTLAQVRQLILQHFLFPLLAPSHRVSLGSSSTALAPTKPIQILTITTILQMLLLLIIPSRVVRRPIVMASSVCLVLRLLLRHCALMMVSCRFEADFGQEVENAWLDFVVFEAVERSGHFGTPALFHLGHGIVTFE